jgi:hypothetical protein
MSVNLEHIFPMRNSIYLIPYWVMAVLKRNGLKHIDILNFTKIRPILSMEDLASIEACQSLAEDLLGTGDVVSASIVYEWYSSSDQELKDTLRREIEPLAKSPTLRDTVKERLQLEEYAPAREALFEVLPLEDKAVGIVLYPGIFSGIMYDRQFEITRALLRLLYVYEQPTDVAGHPLFRRYLDLLSSRKP